MAEEGWSRSRRIISSTTVGTLLRKEEFIYHQTTTHEYVLHISGIENKEADKSLHIMQVTVS